MKKVLVEISYSGNNFSAYLPSLPGCVSTGETPEEMKENIKEAVSFHLEGMEEDNDPILKEFESDYEFAFKFDTQSLLQYYSGILSLSALERLTGINQRQLSHYANGVKVPRRPQVDKIENALHHLGEELMTVEL